MDAQTERAEEIFCDALEIENEGERQDFIDTACSGDSVLQAMVEGLLSEHKDSERLFKAINPTSFSVVELAETLIDGSESGGDEIPTLPDDDEVGKQIGLYKLLKKIGEGGGGNVYLAEQEKPVRRQVALKIIKLGMDTKSVIARFEAERQALAMMEHPNIAHVLNAGETETGRPFFVMELVNGIPVTTYCEQYDLDIPKRLELFVQICHAIQHAHQKSIIHRDIKPSNVLIAQLDGIAVPKVIDFGIAKATGEDLLSDGTFFTSTEQFIGTPAYMSPEQADLASVDIDVRSDIYSLGVLLYELLSSKTPFDQKKLIRAGLEEMRRTIREREPPKPSKKLADLPSSDLANIAESRHLHPHRLLALLAGDLDWIVMKAMEKDRERRYRSADGLADDIQRYLNHEPVIARPPSRLYRLRKLARRNKGVFASGSIVVAVLLVNSSVSTWLLIKERLAQQHALRAEQEKGAIQQEAETLRGNVEDQEKVAKALVLFHRHEMEPADALLDGIKHPSASPGYASMYRDLGDWHAQHGRWEKAKARFDVLVQINEFEGADSSMDDQRSAALLVEQGYREDYERFRESLINRYAGTDSPSIAQRVLRACLLAPANKEVMNALEQYATVTERSYSNIRTDTSVKGWQAYSMALWTYRCGNYEKSLYWCKQADPSNTHFPTRNFSVQLIRALVLKQMGQGGKAQAQLESSHSAINKFFAEKSLPSGVWKGFWFDRACIRIHLREAEAAIGHQAKSSD